MKAVAVTPGKPHSVHLRDISTPSVEKMVLGFAATILCYALALSNPTEGRVYHVHPGGNNANSGLTATEPWRSMLVILYALLYARKPSNPFALVYHIYHTPHHHHLTRNPDHPDPSTGASRLACEQQSPLQIPPLQSRGRLNCQRVA